MKIRSRLLIISSAVLLAACATSPSSSSEVASSMESAISSEESSLITSEESSHEEPVLSDESTEESISSDVTSSEKTTEESITSESSDEESSSEEIIANSVALNEFNGKIVGNYSSSETINDEAEAVDGSSFSVGYTYAMTSSNTLYAYAQLKKSSGIIRSISSLGYISSIKIIFKSSDGLKLSLYTPGTSYEYSDSEVKSEEVYTFSNFTYTHFRVEALSSAAYIGEIEVTYLSKGTPSSSSEVSSEESTSSEESISSEQSISSEESSSSSSFSSVTSGEYSGTYYDSISKSLRNASLKSALAKLLNTNAVDKGYDYAYTAYPSTDTDEDGKIIDIYSSYHWNPTSDHQGCPGKSNYSKEGDLFNREHLIPQSIFNESRPMKSDLHHLYPTDGYVNNQRSNYPHAEVSSAKYVSTNGTKVGSCSTSGYSGNVCEPIDEYKGDVARTYFYFVTRYESRLTSWGNFGAFSKDTYPSLTSWAIKLYMKWAEEDPVSPKEVKRNEEIYKIQKNRNPYIDHPEYVNYIWGSLA
ncbi:MAG: endonuclease [Bacilli bacterium]|nr:endonuclease [Bacilli bacterium]